MPRYIQNEGMPELRHRSHAEDAKISEVAEKGWGDLRSLGVGFDG